MEASWTFRDIREPKSADLITGQVRFRAVRVRINEIHGLSVYAVFRAEIRVIDAVKRANLSRLLLASVNLTEPGEKLAERLALMSLPMASTTVICKYSSHFRSKLMIAASSASAQLG